MAQDELRNKSTGIIHNDLIMQREDSWQLWCVVLGSSLNLLARINYWKDNGMLINYDNCRCGRLVV